LNVKKNPRNTIANPNAARGIPTIAPIIVKQSIPPIIINIRPNIDEINLPVIFNIRPTKFQIAINGQNIIHVLLYLTLAPLIHNNTTVCLSITILF
jgi:hypothetical protein